MKKNGGGGCVAYLEKSIFSSGSTTIIKKKNKYETLSIESNDFNSNKFGTNNILKVHFNFFYITKLTFQNNI